MSNSKEACTVLWEALKEIYANIHIGLSINPFGNPYEMDCGAQMLGVGVGVGGCMFE